MTEDPIYLPISAVEKETRVTKELLRMWERRYGFPTPCRDVNGDRVYTAADIEKLKLLKLMIDRGQRPGKLIRLPIDELRRLQIAGSKATPAMLKETESNELVQLLKSRNVPAVHQWLSRELLSNGLRAFVGRTVAEANRVVGEAWRSGRLSVHEEHLYTEILQNILRHATQACLYNPTRPPRVLLTTVPGEQHFIGLLMAEALLRLEGCEVIPLGTEMPMSDLLEAARSYAVDVVGLSFSASYGEVQTRKMLTTLISVLPPEVSLWAGGAAAAGLAQWSPKVTVVLDIASIPSLVAEWRATTVGVAAS